MIINNLEWKIKISDNLSEDIFGQTNYSNLTIYLNPNCCPRNRRRTLFHEVMHAYCYSYGLQFIENFDKETLCEFISHHFDNICEAFNQAISDCDRAISEFYEWRTVK